MQQSPEWYDSFFFVLMNSEATVPNCLNDAFGAIDKNIKIKKRNTHFHHHIYSTAPSNRFSSAPVFFSMCAPNNIETKSDFWRGKEWQIECYKSFMICERLHDMCYVQMLVAESDAIRSVASRQLWVVTATRVTNKLSNGDNRIQNG